tara:strand:+ start:906 stop:1253 length:348 start_codon:yes stop_codon:yes gene_type:complete
MSIARTISIPVCDLPTANIRLTEKGRGSNKYLGWESVARWVAPAEDFRPDLARDNDGEIKMATLTETEIHEYAAKALKELEAANTAMQRAKDRADSLRMFARELYTAPPLKMVAE